MIGNSVIIWKIILVGMGFSPLSPLHNIDTHAHLLGAGLGPKHMNSNPVPAGIAGISHTGG